MTKNIKNYPQSTLQFVVFFGSFLVLESLTEKYTRIEELHWAIILLLKLALFIPLTVLLNFEKKVRIEKSKIIKGTYNGIFGFIKIEKQFTIDSITEVIMVQNPKEYFEIKVITADDEMIIDTYPNRNPAKEEFERIEKIVKKTAANS
jgi:hypothetical protein